MFGTVARLPSTGVPYLVFSFAGLLGWNLFSNVLSKVGSSLVGNSSLISKIFFPRLVLPLSTVVSALVDLGVSAGMMAVLMIVYHIVPSVTLLLLPVSLLILCALALGLGLWTAALMVSYRDVQYILPVFLNILLYASPVAYGVAAVPARWRWVYLLNPLTPPLEALRAGLLGQPFAGRAAPADFRRGCRRPADGRPVRLQTHGKNLRRCHLAEIAISVRGLSKAYRITHDDQQPSTLAETLLRRARRPFRADGEGNVLGVAGPFLRHPRRRGRRHHRPQRRGQEHAAENPQPHHGADQRRPSTSTAGSARCWKWARASTRNSPGGRTSSSTARSWA